MTAVVAATSVSGCSWAHPGANPYRGDPVAALADFAMPDETRRQLRALMVAHRYTDVATITRNDIIGRERYGGLREMHSGHGQTCHGAVDRSAWGDRLKERGLVFCAGDACVIVPTVCNNVSLVTRKPDEFGQSAEDDGPIDISPAAGPPPPPPTPSMEQASAQSLPDFFPTPASDGGASSPTDDGGSGGASAAPCCFAGGGSAGSGVLGGSVPPGGPGGTPPPVPPVSAVPEAPVPALIFAGLAMILARVRRSGRKNSRIEAA